MFDDITLPVKNTKSYENESYSNTAVVNEYPFTNDEDDEYIDWGDFDITRLY